MNHRISVGALVVHKNKVLMVNHKRASRYDFWVAPGGGVKNTETLEEAVIREAREETGIDVSVKRLMYIEEMYNPEERSVKFWYHCDFISGYLDCSAQEAVSEYIVNVKFMERGNLKSDKIFPEVLRDDFWNDLELDNRTPQLIELRKMEFY